MKFIRVGCFFILLVVCIGYGWLVAGPSETHSATIEAALAASAKRHELRKPQLKDPKVNGYLNPKLGAYFAKGSSAGGPVVSAVLDWNKDFSGQASGRVVEHAALLKAKSVNYLKARNAFGLLTPEIVSAFGMPILQPVNDDFAHPTTRMSFSALRNVAMGLNAFAESLIAEQQYELGALVYELVFREGRLLSDDVGMVQAFQGISLQALAFQSMVATLGPEAKLSPNQWQGLSRAVAATSPTSVTLNQSLENDLALGTAYLSQRRALFDGDGRYLRGLYLLPGLQERDLRIYHNIMGQILEEARKGQIKEPARPDTWAEYFKGGVGSGTGLVVPPDNYRQYGARFVLHNAKMSGLALTTGIYAYRGYYGSLPKTLADLDRLKLEAPGGSPWSKATGIQYQGTGDSPYVAVVVPEELLGLAGLNVAASNALEAKNSTFFTVRPSGFLFYLNPKGEGKDAKREASQTGKASP